MSPTYRPVERRLCHPGADPCLHLCDLRGSQVGLRVEEFREDGETRCVALAGRFLPCFGGSRGRVGCVHGFKCRSQLEAGRFHLEQDVSFELTAVGLQPEEALRVIRVSMGRGNDGQQMDRFVDMLCKAVEEARG